MSAGEREKRPFGSFQALQGHPPLCIIPYPHIHGYFSGTWEGIPYSITGGAGARLQGNDPEHFFHHCMRVHVNKGNVNLTVRRINGENAVVRSYGFLGDNIVEVGLLLGGVICVLSLWVSTIRKKGDL